METALTTLNELTESVVNMDPAEAAEIRNLLLLGREVATLAKNREERRGAHYRDDFPDREPRLDNQHQVLRKHRDCIARQFGPLRSDAPA